MALDLGLDEAFEELTQHLTMKDFDGGSGVSSLVDDENALMRKSRTWFGLLVLEHMYANSPQVQPGYSFCWTDYSQIQPRRWETTGHPDDGKLAAVSQAARSPVIDRFGSPLVFAGRGTFSNTGSNHVD
jgi:hypothetical protein